MRIVLISTPIGFLGSGKGGGVELTLNSLVSGLVSLGHYIDVIAPKDSKLNENNAKIRLHLLKVKIKLAGSIKIIISIIIPDNSLLAGMLEKALEIAKQADILLNLSYDWLIWMTLNLETPLHILLVWALKVQ